MRAFLKDFFREFVRNKGRFISVFFIVLLGAAFFSGIRSNKNSMIYVDLYLVLGYGVKISEVVSEVQKRVKYTIEKALNMDVKGVNVHVEGIKVI